MDKEEEREGEQREPVEGFLGERRPSIMRLQGMLRRVSQSPFYKPYRTPIPSTSESRDCSINDTHLKQNGINRSLSKDNPLFSYMKESSSVTIDGDTENQDSEVLRQQSLATIFAPPPEFQSTTEDIKPDKKQTDNNLQTTPSDQQTYIFKTMSERRSPDLFKTTPLTQNTPTNLSHSPLFVTTSERLELWKTPSNQQDLFKTLPSKTPDTFQVPPTKGEYLFNAPPTKGEDLFQTPPTKGDDLFNAPHTKGDYLFKALPSKTADIFQAPPTKGDDFFQVPPTNGDNLFQALPTKGDYLFKAPPSKTADIFQAPPTKGDDFFQVPPTNGDYLFNAPPNKGEDLFQTPPTKGDDQFQAPPTKDHDLFQVPPTKGDDLFRAPLSIQKDHFQSTPSDTPNLIQATPTRSNDSFQTPSSNVTPDIFQPLPSRTWDIFHSSPNDIFQGASFSTQSTVKQSTPLFQTSSGQKTDIFSGSDFEKTAELFNASLSNTQAFNLATPSDKQYDIFLMTPHGTKHDVLRPNHTALKHGTLQARSMSPTQALNGSPQVKTSNSPPKPAPRKRQPKLPSLNKSEEEVFENILLTGQERCVEDWPEDSPELNPDWKPSGKLRLRRESMKVAADSDGGSVEEELEENGPAKRGKTKKFRVSFLSRRGSKDKYSEDLKDRDSGTLRRGSKDRFFESKDGESNSLRRRSKEGFLDEDFSKKGVDVFSADYEDKENYMEHGKPKKSFKFKMPLVHRRGSKDRFSAERLEKASGLHSPQHRAKEGLLDDDFPQKKAGFISAGENEDEERNGMEDWKQPVGLDENSEEEAEERDGTSAFEKSKRVKIKFVPQRGFAICLEKSSQDEPTGARGYTPRRGSKTLHEKPLVELKGANGYTPRKESKVNIFEETEEVKGYVPQSHPKSFLDDYLPEKGACFFSAGEVEEYQQNVMEDCKPKKPFKLKVLHMNRRKSGSAEENPQISSTQQYSPQRRSEEGFLDSDVPQKGADLFYAGQMEDEQNEMEDWKPKKPSKFKNRLASRRKSNPIQETFLHEKSQIGSERYTPRRASHEGFLDDGTSQRRSDLFSAGGNGEDDEQDDIEDCKPKKSFKFKAPHKHRKGAKNKVRDGGMTEYPPGATSSDYYFSEAAEAEWRSAQIDEQLAEGLEDEEEEEGDTDSLMEWWNTVEQWDELPSDDEDKTVKDDETRSFTLLAEKVHRGLSVFNKVFTERAEVLWQYVIKLHALADDITSFHKKAKIGNITGGTTAAVGGGAAIVGLALAPFTFGASLIITAVGVGVAAAGGITSASATISDNVNNMQDRKKVEVVLEDYEARMEELVKILRFVCQGLYRLRGHPLLRRGTQHYSGDWEVRRAVHMVSLVDRPVLRATEVTEGAAVALRGLFKGMDKYFTKDSRELKKGFKKEVVFKIRQVAQVLYEGLVELNAIREELQDANGNI
ncbi:uncharacterized protein si:cabz01007807.1 isoform X2 [Coregonus clupeaformis]|uniref:uncharacterized protein si:cabz01007807.1 isoform X2 n=1 Tax=Coregonus clupeaformis TaxID=59861 RepID=UPI001E1C50C7|nr:uncharacterized protein si:cabz01007807.1 isoform X2 [Coregonus clupeaformis]